MSFYKTLFTRVRGTPAPPQEAPAEAADEALAIAPPQSLTAHRETEPAVADPPAATLLVETTAPSEPAATVAPPGKWLDRLKQGMAKSSKTLTSGIADIFTKRRLDAATLGELEEVLIRADLGPATAHRIAAAVGAGRYDREIDPEDVKRILAAEVANVLIPS